MPIPMGKSQFSLSNTRVTKPSGQPISQTTQPKIRSHRSTGTKLAPYTRLATHSAPQMANGMSNIEMYAIRIGTLSGLIWTIHPVCTELLYTPQGAAIAQFSITSSEGWKDKNGELQERTNGFP